MYSLMNCTPHPISVLQFLFKGEVLVFGSSPATGLQVPHRRRVKQDRVEQDALVIPPSGYRLACDALTSGPDLGCQVRYDLGDDSELRQIWDAFAQNMGVTMIVVASEISVRALDGRLYDAGAGTPIEAMWPVLARASLRRPMPERWADKLATLPR